MYVFIDYGLDCGSGVSRKLCFYCVCGEVMLGFKDGVMFGLTRSWSSEYTILHRKQCVNDPRPIRMKLPNSLACLSCEPFYHPRPITLPWQETSWKSKPSLGTAPSLIQSKPYSAASE